MREACSVYYSAEIAVDHITDHLPFRSTRKQWIRERRRVRFSERKGAEMPRNKRKQVLRISLGPGDRAFEPHYSDQNPSEIVDFRGVFLILCLLRRKI